MLRYGQFCAPCRSSRDRVGFFAITDGDPSPDRQVRSGGHEVAADAEKLRDLHVRDDPLLLTNFEIRCPPALLNPPLISRQLELRIQGNPVNTR